MSQTDTGHCAYKAGHEKISACARYKDHQTGIGLVFTRSVMLDNMIEKIVILYGVHNAWVILSVCHIMSHFSVSLANSWRILEVLKDFAF